MNHLNLWPENLDHDPAGELTPKAILADAATELWSRTHREVEAQIFTRGAGDTLELSFYLRPVDVDYQYLLFKVRHGLDGFPVQIIDPSQFEPKSYPTRAKFEDGLRELFGRAATRSVVARLRSLSRAQAQTETSVHD